MNQYIGKSRGGNVNDNTLAIDLLSSLDIKSANILGDKAYGTKDIRNYITSDIIISGSQKNK